MNPAIRSWIRETDDRYYDPGGTVLRQAFAVAEVLSAPDCADDVPEAMQFRHGAYRPLTLADFIASDPDDGSGDGEWYYEAQYARLLAAGTITPDDLEHAGRVLSRLLDSKAMQARSY